MPNTRILNIEDFQDYLLRFWEHRTALKIGGRVWSAFEHRELPGVRMYYCLRDAEMVLLLPSRRLCARISEAHTRILENVRELFGDFVLSLRVEEQCTTPSGDFAISPADLFRPTTTNPLSWSC